MNLTNAQSGMVVAGLLGLIGFILIMALIPAIVAYMALNKIPEQHRKQNPVLAFLLIIPLFGLIWGFFVHPKVAASLASWAAEKNDTRHGDCGAQLALWTAILPIACLVPMVNMLAGPAALILFIIFYVKAFDISGKIASKV